MKRYEREHAEGYTSIDTGSDFEYHIPFEHHALVMEAWTAGKPFFYTETMYGELFTIKLSGVKSIVLVTAASLAEREEADKDAKARELTE